MSPSHAAVPLNAAGALEFSRASIETSQIQDRTTSDAHSGNGVVEYEYDGESRLSKANSVNGSVPDYEYTHDKVGNVLKEKVDANSTWFGYDYAGQLCWQDSVAHNTTGDDHELDDACQNVSGATNYTHDAAGNNTGTSTGPRTYNDNSQVTQIGGGSTWPTPTSATRSAPRPAQRRS